MSHRPNRPRRRRTFTPHFERLELRQLLAASHDLIGVTALRNDPEFTGIDGSGVSVVIIDSGVDITHPLLAPNYLFDDTTGEPIGQDFIHGGTNPTPVDLHGTHVAGIVGAADPNIGIATGVNLIGLQVFPSASPGDSEPGASDRVIENALRWVLDHHEQYNIVAANMSLGFGFFLTPSEATSHPWSDEIRALEEAGVAVVSAAGNSYGILAHNARLYGSTSLNKSGSPGILSTFNVGAVYEGDPNDTGRRTLFEPAYGNGAILSADLDPNADQIVVFSQRPLPQLDSTIFAPGAVITSTVPGGGLFNTQGTSMAAPMVAGAVALMQDAALTFGNRLLSTNELQSIVMETADVITDDADDTVFVSNFSADPAAGSGIQPMLLTELTYRRINVYEAIKEVKRRVSPQRDQNGTLETATRGPTLRLSSPFAPSPIGQKYAPPVLPLVVRGTIGSDGDSNIGAVDVDIYRFVMATSGELSVTLSADVTSPQDFDSILRVFNAAGEEVAFDDGIGFSSITAELPQGQYYAAVSGATNQAYDPESLEGREEGAMGTYQLAFAIDTADVDSTIDGANDLGLVEPGAFQFENRLWTDDGNTEFLFGDKDTYRFELRDTSTFGLTLRNLNNLQTVMATLHDASGIVIESTDMSGGTVSLETHLAGGIYYFQVSGSPVDRVPRQGNYRVSLQITADDTEGSIAQLSSAAETIHIGQTIRDGIMQRIGEDAATLFVRIGADVDMIKVRPSESGLLVVDIDSITDATIPDTEKVATAISLLDAQGKVLGRHVPIGGQADPLLQIEVDESNIYYIAISGIENTNFDPQAVGSGGRSETGDYRLTVRLESPSQVAMKTNDTQVSGQVQSVGVGSVMSDSVGSDSGVIRGVADIDLFRFEANDAGLVVFSTLATSAFSSDTFMRLFLEENGQLTEVANNDNANPRVLESQISHWVTAGETYYVGVNGAGTTPTAYDPSTGAGAEVGDLGDYLLSVTEGIVPSLSIVADHADKVEGDAGVSVFTFEVKRTGDVNVPVDVDYSVSGSGAMSASASDFVGDELPGGIIHFDAGQTTQLLDVFISGDTTTEPDEEFRVTLSNATNNATISTATATGSIRNDDIAVAPAVLIVTTLEDTVANDSQLSLREAIQLANEQPGPDTIRFQEGLTGTISFAGLLSGELAVTTGELLIVGPGRDSLILDAQYGSRVLRVDAGASVTIRSLTMSNGRALEGGGVFNNGELVLDDVRITGNIADREGGGGIWNGSGGMLTINASSIDRNKALQITIASQQHRLFTSHGGGIFNSAGSVAINDSLIFLNEANGISDTFSYAFAQTLPRISTASLVGGDGELKLPERKDEIPSFGVVRGLGGGIFNRSFFDSSGRVKQEGKVTLLHSSVQNNASIDAGGGIFNFGTLTVRDSSVFENTSGNEGGGIASSNNLQIINSTVGWNQSEKTAHGGIFIGAFEPVFMSSEILHSTVAFNRGNGVTSTFGSLRTGGSIFAANELNDLTVSGNTTHYNRGYNLIGSSAGIKFVPAPSDILGVDAGLTAHPDAIAYALNPASPAIDAGPPNFDLNQFSPSLNFDQPEQNRIFNGRIDIGAVEYSPDPFVIVESDGGTTVSESGTSDTITVTLFSQPLTDVVVRVVSVDTDEVTVDASVLTFTSANWNVPQTVTVTGSNDSILDGDQRTLITLSINDANSDDAFDLLSDQTVSVTTADIAAVLVNLPIASPIEVTIDGDDVVVRSDSAELFRGLGSELMRLDLLGSSGDEVVRLGNLSTAFSGHLGVHGGEGFDTLQWRGAGVTVDLTGLAGNVSNFEVIDVAGTGRNSLFLDPDAVAAITPVGGVLMIRYGEDDAVNYGRGWVVDSPRLRNGELVHAIRQGQTTLEIANPLPFQNPLKALDSNRDGNVSPIDALIVINRLNDRGAGQLANPDANTDLPAFQYIDTNGDNFVSPIDALQVINALNEPLASPEGEAVAWHTAVNQLFGTEPSSPALTTSGHSMPALPAIDEPPHFAVSTIAVKAQTPPSRLQTPTRSARDDVESLQFAVDEPDTPVVESQELLAAIDAFFGKL